MARIKLNPNAIRALGQLKGIDPKTPIKDIKLNSNAIRAFAQIKDIDQKTTIGQLQRATRKEEFSRKPSVANTVALLRDKEKTVREVDNALDKVILIAEKLYQTKMRREGMRDAQRALQTGKVESKLLNALVQPSKTIEPFKLDKKTIKEAINIAVAKKEIPKEIKPIFERRVPYPSKLTQSGKTRLLQELNAVKVGKASEYDSESNLLPAFKTEQRLKDAGINVSRKKETRPKLPVMKSPRVLEGKDKTNAMMYEAEDKLIRQNLRRGIKDNIYLGFKDRMDRKYRKEDALDTITDNQLKQEFDDYIKNWKLSTQPRYVNHPSNVNHPSMWSRWYPNAGPYDAFTQEIGVRNAKEKHSIPSDISNKIYESLNNNSNRAKYQQEYLDTFMNATQKLKQKGKTKPTPRTRKPQDDEKLFNRKYILELEDLTPHEEWAEYVPRVRSRKTGQELNGIDWNEV
jgi:hypothetical protein